MSEEEPLSTNPLVNRFMAQRNPVEKFLAELPIIGEAYQNKEYYKADQFIREQTEKGLRTAKDAMQNIQAKLGRKGDNDGLSALSIVEQKLETTLNKIKSAVHGINGFGSGFTPTEEQMDGLLEYDQNLHGKALAFAEEMKTGLSELANSGAIKEAWEAKVDEWSAFLDTIVKDVEDRKKTIIELISS